MFFNGPPGKLTALASDPTYQRILATGNPQAIANAKLAARGGGILDSIARAAANNAAFQGADVTAALDASIPLDSGSSIASNWNQRFEENLNNQYLRSAADTRIHPFASEIGGSIGDALNPMLGLFSFAPPGILNRIAGLGLGHALNGQAYALRMHDQGKAQRTDILGNVVAGVTGGIIGGD